MPTPAIVIVVSGFGKDGIFTCLCCVCVCVCVCLLNEEILCIREDIFFLLREEPRQKSEKIFILVEKSIEKRRRPPSKRHRSSVISWLKNARMSTNN